MAHDVAGFFLIRGCFLGRRRSHGTRSRKGDKKSQEKDDEQAAHAAARQTNGGLEADDHNLTVRRIEAVKSAAPEKEPALLRK